MQDTNEGNTSGETGKAAAFDSGVKIHVKAVGSSGTETNGGYFAEEYLQQLKGKQGAKTFDEMRRSEPQVSMILNGILNPIKAANWQAEAADEMVVADAQKHADFINMVLSEGIDFQAFLQEAHSFLVFGYAILEEVHNVVYNHPKFGTFNGLAELGFRSQKTIEKWNFNKETKKLESVSQEITSDVGKSADIPTQFLLIISLQKEGDNYEGISPLRPMFGPWFRKNLYLKLTAIGVEKSAVGTPKAKVPTGKEKSQEFENLKKILESYTSHENAYITYPEGWEIEIEWSSFDPSKLKDLVTFENTEMVNAVVANFLALGMNGGGGAFALGTDLSDFFLGGIQSYANLVCDALNRKTIPDLIKMNFGPQAAYPKMRCTGINDKAGKELSEVISSFVNNGVITADEKLEDFVRKQYDLPEADKTTARPKTATAATPNATPTPAAPAPTDDIAQVTDEVRKDPTTDVQKTALNGAQVTSMLEVVSKVVSREISAATGKQVLISAFNISDEEASKIIGDAGSGPAPTPAPVTLTESERIVLAETYEKDFDAAQEEGEELMSAELRTLLDNMKAEVKTLWDTSTPANRVLIGPKIEATGVTLYRQALREFLAKTANQAMIGARKEVPGAKNVKLSESIQLAAPRGGYYAALPPNIRKLIDAQSALISQTQAMDLQKVVAFQFNSSQTSTDSIDQILQDIEDAAGKIMDGSTSGGISVQAAASNAVAEASNQARLEFFFEPEVLDQIESFTFVNDDPVSEVCKQLDGTTWAVGDPNIDRYTPPLHHLCKSRLSPNLKGDKNNPAVDKGTPSLSQAAIKQITLCEHHGHGLIARVEDKRTWWQRLFGK